MPLPGLWTLQGPLAPHDTAWISTKHLLGWPAPSLRPVQDRGVGPQGDSFRPLRAAELAEGSGLDGHNGHDVSQTHRCVPARARTSMTSIFPRLQAGQSVSDVPVRAS